MLWMRLFVGFLALFTTEKVWSAGQVSADLPRHVSSWTPPAYDVSMGSEEEKDELFAVPIQLRTPEQWARLQELIGASSRSILLPSLWQSSTAAVSCVQCWFSW